ncbi:MAG TPA: DNA-binding protein [bacterium]|nr:DNA-binding protein [bacterium]HOL46936.1 DNA-binding protein [bacterium]HPQ18202.1 DNA-binding protein [bacterium]
MKYTEAKFNRVFILRLEDGDIIHETIEKFAKEKNIKSAVVILLGGADKDSKLVVGPKESRAAKIEPMEYILNNAYEMLGVGTIFLDEKNEPILHLHISAGREAQTITGCIRLGVKTWYIGEVIIIELTDCKVIRKYDTDTGFKLMTPI